MPSESDKWGWEHVSVFGGFDRGSGTKRWKCNHCNLRYNGSYSRVRAHLLGFSGVGIRSCPAIDKSLREAFHILEGERVAQKKKKNTRDRKAVKCGQTSQPSPTSKPIKKDDVDDVVARFLYADGSNVDIVNSPYFHEMVKAIGLFGPGYEPPPLDKLSDSFLSKEKAKIEKSIAIVRESWPHTGCTILCIGQLDAATGSLHINLFVSSPRGIIFFKAVYADGINDADHVLTGALGDAIMEVGPYNVVQIISQLGTTCKSSASYICSKYTNIFWSPCTSHSILMLMEEIAELEWVKPVVLCAKEIEQCMITYQHVSSFLCLQNLKLDSDPISVKYAPSCCFIQRIFGLRPALQEVVLSEEWKQWKLSVGEDVVGVESAILGDGFWSKAHLLLQLYEPFLRLLDKFDIDKSVNGAIYDWRVQALEAIRSKVMDDGTINQMEGLIESRWDALFSPLHAAGYILNPRYFGKGQAKDKSVMRGWKTTLEIYESESTARRVLREQLSSYWRLEGSFGEEDAVDCRDKMDPVAWWENFGFETPNLQTLAIKVLSQVSSVTMCQQIWQTNHFSCQDAANKFGVQRVEDLLFVRNNLKLNNPKCSSLCSSSGARNVVSYPKSAITTSSP